jgi:hypothetical protein
MIGGSRLGTRRVLALAPLWGLLWLGRASAQDESPTPPATSDADRAASEYNRELRTVEQDVNGLKERVFRSKATLQLLKELVLDGSSRGSQIALWHINKMSSAYTLESIQYVLDGKSIYSKSDGSGALDDLREVKLLEQAMPPGTHNLQVSLVLRGNGFGVFSYLKTYSFKVQSSYTFSVEDGRATVLKVVANERGGPWRTFVDRPNVEYEEKAEALKEE